MYRYVHTDILTPLDKYQDQVQKISESYGNFQSFQYFCEHNLDIYLTEMVEHDFGTNHTISRMEDLLV